MHISNNIKKARLLRGYSQDEIAEKLAIKRSTYAEWENKTVPRADIFWRLAALLRVEPADLLSETWEPDEKSSFNPSPEKKKISLETLQKGLENILHHQAWTRAEVRAYGQYPVTRDAKGDEHQTAKILAGIGRLAAEYAKNIAKESIRADEHS